MSDKSERAVALFRAGFNCAQSVFAAFAAELDLDEEDALRVAGGLGLGARVGELCGAASGAALAIGAKFGATEPTDTGAKANCAAKTRRFMDEFAARNGSLRCRDLLGLDVTADDAKERIAERGLHASICEGLVAAAVELTAAILED
ncbi:MAG: C-GCAxxG-C-C family protein [Oscillospiraceae bacterium]|jgi:C_GCAxxG_C_C family probable redox protein|nr:C-GCAxxG-C-C family protein [Oscillospiraceae bacterium]